MLSGRSITLPELFHKLPFPLIRNISKTLSVFLFENVSYQVFLIICIFIWKCVLSGFPDHLYLYLKIYFFQVFLIICICIWKYISFRFSWSWSTLFSFHRTAFCWSSRKLRRQLKLISSFSSIGETFWIFLVLMQSSLKKTFDGTLRHI